MNGGNTKMKKLKKLSKKTVEAYACPNCGTPNDCISSCAGDIPLLNDGATFYARAMTSGN